jgi:transcriptional regulator with XRE-family HTH domain
MANKPIPEHQLKRLEYISIFLRELRLNDGLTQEELCQHLNLHRNTVIRAENSGNLTLMTIFTLADALNVSPKELFADIE